MQGLINSLYEVDHMFESPPLKLKPRSIELYITCIKKEDLLHFFLIQALHVAIHFLIWSKRHIFKAVHIFLNNQKVWVH